MTESHHTILESVGRFSRCVALLAIFSSAACWLLPESPYRQALPEGAREVLEDRSGTVDFVYLLRARISRAEFDAYVADLALLPMDPSGEVATGAAQVEVRRAAEEPEWWSPIGPADEAYRLRVDGDVILAKYEDDFLYLSVVHL